MINLAEIITDPDLAQSFTILRPPATGSVGAASFKDEGTWTNEGTFGDAGFGDAGFGDGAPGAQPAVDTVIQTLGVVTPSKNADVTTYVPEGDRLQASVTLYSPVQILMDDGQGQQADLIVWQGRTYRVTYAKQWQTFGYWWAMATFVPQTGDTKA